MIEPPILLEAYRQGIFPMALDGGEIGWFSPNPRGVIPIVDFKVPHGLRRTLQKGRFEIRIDTAFEEVMRSCGARAETWISEEIILSYLALHRAGGAHSVETWLDGRLAGGLYGVSIAGAFFGESMFHRETDASKVALYALIQRLRARGFTLLDTQWINAHLRQFGAHEIPRREYLRQLQAALALPCTFVEGVFDHQGTKTPS